MTGFIVHRSSFIGLFVCSVHSVLKINGKGHGDVTCYLFHVPVNFGVSGFNDE
jgi:hypothetical protein